MQPIEQAIADIGNIIAAKNRRIASLEAEVDRLVAALRRAADMTEFEDDRTLIYNHCMASADGPAAEPTED